MPKWVTLDHGTSHGRCGSCGQMADLHLTESSYQRRWYEALKVSIDDRVDRRVRCSTCRRTYPVRATDDSPLPAAARGTEEATGRTADPVVRPARGRRASDRASDERRRRSDA